MVNDLAYLTIDFKADFSPLFDWNTKQLFIYIFAEYSTTSNVCKPILFGMLYILFQLLVFVASQPGCVVGQDNTAWRKGSY